VHSASLGVRLIVISATRISRSADRCFGATCSILDRAASKRFLTVPTFTSPFDRVGSVPGAVANCVMVFSSEKVLMVV
jgi:hypothetical protein